MKLYLVNGQISAIYTNFSYIQLSSHTAISAVDIYTCSQVVT